MSRFIDAIKLKSDMMEAICQGYTEEDMLGIVNEQDTADVVEVKHGHWIIEDIPGTDWYRVICSECGEIVTSVAPLYAETGCGFKYCPNCGAKMDEVAE